MPACPAGQDASGLLILEPLTLRMTNRPVPLVSCKKPIVRSQVCFSVFHLCLPFVFQSLTKGLRYILHSAPTRKNSCTWTTKHRGAEGTPCGVEFTGNRDQEKAGGGANREVGTSEHPRRPSASGHRIEEEGVQALTAPSLRFSLHILGLGMCRLELSYCTIFEHLQGSSFIRSSRTTGLHV